jgi:hypothetical protein
MASPTAAARRVRYLKQLSRSYSRQRRPGAEAGASRQLAALISRNVRRPPGLLRGGMLERNSATLADGRLLDRIHLPLEARKLSRVLIIAFGE